MQCVQALIEFVDKNHTFNMCMYQNIVATIQIILTRWERGEVSIYQREVENHGGLSELTGKLCPL